MSYHRNNIINTALNRRKVQSSAVWFFFAHYQSFKAVFFFSRTKLSNITSTWKSHCEANHNSLRGKYACNHGSMIRKQTMCTRLRRSCLIDNIIDCEFRMVCKNNVEQFHSEYCHGVSKTIYWNRMKAFAFRTVCTIRRENSNDHNENHND